jgi:hypothetical protein
MSTQDIQAILSSVAEYAFLDRGNGHYCTVASNNAKRRAAGTHYEVHVDMFYQAVACYERDAAGKIVGECRAYKYSKKHCCGHMIAVNNFYMLQRGRLLDDAINPVVEVVRKNAKGIFQRFQVRRLQMSADEQRAAYQSSYEMIA